MRIAITGVAGYLGRLLLERLGAEPTVDSIVGFDRAGPPAGCRKLEFHRMDMRDGDFASHLGAVDALLHLAFVVTPDRRISAAQTQAINVDGSRRLFEAALERGVPRIVFASSMAAYGAHPDNPAGIGEEHPRRPNPDWYYSSHKGAVEAMLDEIERRSPRTIVIRLRPAVLLGASVDNVISRALERRTLVSAFGHPQSFVWDADVVEAFRLALDHPRSAAFNLAAEGTLTVERCGELLGRRVAKLDRRVALWLARLAGWLRLAPRGAVEWIVACARGPIVLDASRARRELGWRTTRDVEQTLLDFAATRERESRRSSPASPPSAPR